MTTTIAMSTRTIQYFFLFSILVILAACSPFQTSLERFKQDVASLRAAYPAATPEYLTQEIPPCTPVEGSTAGPCEPDVSVVTGPGAMAGSIAGEPGVPPSVRQFLEGGSIISISHIVIRGTYIPKTIRCVNGVPYRVPSYEIRGYFQNSSLMQCCVDVRVNAYMLGSGPSELTVVMDFHHYFEGVSKHIDEITLSSELIMEDGYPARPGRDGPRAAMLGRSVGLDGREVIMFIGPFHNHATEVWRANRIWDVQRQDDGTVIAVSPARGYWKYIRSEEEFETHRAVLEMELPAFTSAVTAAHNARVSEYGGRIAPANDEGKRPGAVLPMLITDANRMSNYYIATGAHSHPDGPPAKPIPACGQAVPDRGDANRPLIFDCRFLLESKDALAGTATLKWSADIAIGSWTGVTTTGTPERVGSVNLSSSSLNGSIPDGLGDLSALTTLDLSSNQLTGAIPASLGELSDLSTLSLSGNAFSGCIPPALRDVTTNDLASVGLSYCDMLTPPPAPDGVDLALADGVFTISWDAVSGADKYEAQHQPGSTVDEWTALPETEELTITYTPAEGLACGTVYRFRVRSYGDWTMHSADWGTPSNEVTHTTEPCNQAPDFDTDSYSFTVDESVLTGVLVGTVSATGPDDGMWSPTP